MKLTAILLFAATLQVSANAYSQRVTLSEINVPLKKVFTEIRKQTGYIFFCNESLFENAKAVTVNIKDASLETALDICLKGQALAYSIVGNNIVIKETENKAAVNYLIAAPVPRAEIQGRIINEKGEPVAGASVKIKGTKTGVASENNGTFSIEANPDNILVISYVGYESQEIIIRGAGQINITLIPSNNSLNDVVVTGYSTQRKKDITGAISLVDMKAMKSIPAGTGEQALQGQASGVTIISSGAPGEQSSVFVRGLSSFGNNTPLIIVDGVQSSLSDINISDIESVQVLKDAGAAAIYGVRGSNGVIIVSTRKGRSGEPTVSYDAYIGNQVPLKGNVFNLMNSQDFATVTKRVNSSTALFQNGLPDYLYGGPGVQGVGMEGDPAVDPSKYNFDEANPENNYLIQKVNKQGTDWFHEVFKPAVMQNHYLSLSGGTDKSNYLFSVGYLDQQGTLIETYLKRYSVRLNTQFKIKKHIRIGENAYIYYKKNPKFYLQDERSGVASTFIAMPIVPVRDIMGNYGGSFAGPDLDGKNAVAVQENTHNDKYNTWVITGNLYAEADILKHFTARTSFGGSIINQYGYRFRHNTYYDILRTTSPNGLDEDAAYSINWIWTNTLKYSNTFGKHDLTILAGSEAIENDGRGVGGSSSGLFSTDPAYYALGNGTSEITNYSNSATSSLFSLFSRLDYSYDNRYLFAATVRRDGASSFGSDNRYGVFPSFSAGWRISNEKFMKGISWINDLKLRGSWGKLGSANNIRANNPYTLFTSDIYFSYYDIRGTSNNPSQGFYQISIGNSKTRWEEDIITNVGIDASILNNKIDFSIERYIKKVNGLLFPQPLPATAGGAQSPIINIGDIQNKGWDISATYHGKKGSNFQYSIGANITAYKNTITDIPGLYFDGTETWNGTLVRNQVGHPIGSFFGYDVVGLFRDQSDVDKSPTQEAAAPGRFKYRDVDGDGEITTEDRTWIGSPHPDFTYGVNLGASFKNFDFSAVFYGSQGNKVYNNTRLWTDFYGSFLGAKSNKLLYDAWTPTNLDAQTPIAETDNNFSNSGVPNSYYVLSGSFLKCRSLILGYSVNSKVLQKYGVNKFRVYLQAANLFTLTKYDGLDPEVTGYDVYTGIDNGNYPNNQKNLIFGLNLSF